MIKTVIFDLGGVVITIDQQQAVDRFRELGLTEATKLLDPYTQGGIFGALENGLITAEEFRDGLSSLVGYEVTPQQCAYAWQGYAKDVPQRNLDALLRLRENGFRVVLLSNTNPYMMEWALSDRFDGKGHALDYYFDALYLSYRLKLMKPDQEFFRRVLMSEQALPSDCLFIDDGPRNVAAASEVGINTLCPENGSDWTAEVFAACGLTTQ